MTINKAKTWWEMGADRKRQEQEEQDRKRFGDAFARKKRGTTDTTCESGRDASAPGITLAAHQAAATDLSDLRAYLTAKHNNDGVLDVFDAGAQQWLTADHHHQRSVAHLSVVMPVNGSTAASA